MKYGLLFPDISVLRAKKKHSDRKGALREISIELYSFDIFTYVQIKADAIDALIDLDVKVVCNDMSDQILELVERDFRLTDHLSFQLTQENFGYHRFIADILVYSNSPSIKLKYGKRDKTHKVNMSPKTL